MFGAVPLLGKLKTAGIILKKGKDLKKAKTINTLKNRYNSTLDGADKVNKGDAVEDELDIIPKRSGGSVQKSYGGGLRRWFKEDWTDVKTGEPCGRKSASDSSRPYPYCRPANKVSSKTPATTKHPEAKSRAKSKTGPTRVKPITR